MTDQTPAQTGYSRVFLIEGRAAPDHEPSYESNLKMMGLDQALGDRTDIEIPDPNQYGKFLKVAKVRGTKGPATTSLVGRYALDLRSKLVRLSGEGCEIDVHLHWGTCETPSLFNQFQKAVILEDVILTNIGTDDLGALATDENAQINETGDIAAREFYEIVQLNFAKRAAAAITNEIIDAVLCDTPGCGDCADPTNGCKKIYAVSLAAGGSPGTPADVVYTLDGGSNFYAHDVDSLGAAEDPTGIDCLAGYVVVVSNDSASLHYAAKEDFKAGSGDPAFTEVTAGFVAGGEPNAIFVIGSKAFIVGDSGYVYTTTDPTIGVTVVDAGAASAATLLDVHAISENFAVAVGNDGTVIYTTDGETWGTAVFPVGVGVNLNCVFMKSKKEWWVGSSGGQLFYTKDQGATWTEKTFTNSGTGSVLDIEFPTDSVGYLSHQTSATKGAILRSYNGGHSWVVLPETTATLPAVDKFNTLVTCPYDANFVLAAGLEDDGADGTIVIGAAA